MLSFVVDRFYEIISKVSDTMIDSEYLDLIQLIRDIVWRADNEIKRRIAI